MAPVRPEEFDYTFQPNGLKTLRENLKLTQADMAVLLDIPVNTLSRWERGSNSPDANALAAIYSIAQERGTTPKFFVRRPNPMTARMKRETLVFHWDFQNRAIDNRYISEEWSYMEQYISMLFPRTEKSVRIAYTSNISAHTQLREAGFRISSTMYDADSQIIGEGRRLFDISGNSHPAWSVGRILTQLQLNAFGQTLAYDESFCPERSVYTLISNDGDYVDFLKELRRAGAEVFVWGTDECSARLRDVVGEDHFIPWERPYVTVKCMEVARELKGRPISKGEFGNMCKKALDETGNEIFPEDAGFSPKSPYASVLKHMELNRLVRIRDLNGANKISITVRRD